MSRSVLGGVLLGAFALVSLDAVDADARNRMPPGQEAFSEKDVSGNIKEAKLKSIFTNTYKKLSGSDGVENEINYVDRHIVFALDASNSIDYLENTMLINGVANAILDPAMNYNNCYAMTAVRFSETTLISPTYVFCSMEGAQEFVQMALKDTSLTTNKSLGLSTDVTAAIMAAGYIWDGEGKYLKFTSNHKDLIFVGDGPDNVDNTNKQGDFSYTTMDLAKRYGATSHGVAIAQPKTQYNAQIITENTFSYYKGGLTTPSESGINYYNPKVHGDFALNLRPGQYKPVYNFEGVQEAVGGVLRASLN